MAERCHSTSAPAQNAGPSPASRTTRASPTSANASVSSAISSASKALRRSGFASVTRRTCPSRSTFSAFTTAHPMVSTVPAKTFTVELERVQKTATMFRVPFDLAGAFGRARPPVKVTIRGHTWRTTPGVYGGVGHVVVNRAVKAATGVDAPDRVRVVMELDDEPRTVQVPADLRAALREDPAAKEAFSKLSYSHR